MSALAHSVPAIPPHVARRAVEWLLELQADDNNTELTRQALNHWLAQHPDHQRAWQRIETVNGKLQQLASPLGSQAAHAALTAPRSISRREAVKTLAVLLFAGGAALGIKEQTPWREWVADARTGVGERRSITLADGTSVMLNTDSAININFSATERRVYLISGEILVTTSSDSSSRPRPFVVATEQGELQPLGTRFAVHQQATVSHVAVFEGAVAIHPSDAAAARTLQAGEQARFTRTTISHLTPASEASTAWTEGMLVASGMRLADFLAELSRHRPGHLSCAPEIADLRVSGTYPLADTDRILDTLRTTLPVEIHFRSRYWVTVRGAQG